MRQFPPVPGPAAPWRYASAPAATFFCCLLQLAVFPHPGIAPFVLFYVAVVTSSWLGGRGPGLFAVALSAATANYVAGKVVGAVAIIRDITDKKQTEDALREADRRKDEFLAVLSHELRNPLAPIRSSLYVLDHAPPGGEQARRAKTVIERQINQMTRLVSDLLDVSRITRGKIQLQRERSTCAT